MEDYFFFLGRNPDLSLQEIISFLETRGIKGKFHLEENIALFSLESPINCKEVISRLGGTIKIGKTSIKRTSEKDFVAEIEKTQLYLGTETKLKYTLTAYPAELNSIKDILDNYFKVEKIKALYRQSAITPSGSMKFDMEYFAIKFKQYYYFGNIEGVYDTKDAEFRDMNKPFRRSEYGISPRIAKILINLSGADKGETLLDPFCGIGTIIQEAMLQNINVIGADIDSGVIENCKRNIRWLRGHYSIDAGYQIYVSNAIDLPQLLKEKVDAIASEPFLIPLITYTPKETEAKKMITKAKYTYINTFKELKKILKDGGRIALSLPVMKSREGQIYLNIEEVCTEVGLKLIAGPFSESREGQRVSREIVLLEK